VRSIHDILLAITSQCRILSLQYSHTAANLERLTDSEVIKFSAGGFRDFTRSPPRTRPCGAKSSSTNDAVLEMLGRLSEDLTALQSGHPYA